MNSTLASSKRPNILFAFADDWGRYASVYKDIQTYHSLNNFITTPTLDKIASEGVLFTNAFVPAPTCTPCRSSVLSGRYFWQTRLGAILQGAVWDGEIPTYPRILKKEGYHIGSTYKTWGPGVYVGNHPCGEDEDFYQSGGNDFGQFSQVATTGVAQGLSVEEAKQPLYDEVLKNFTSFLDAQNEDQPFYYWWGPTNTHRIWQKGSGKQLWNINPDDLKGAMPKFFPDVHDVREDVADYLGECMAFDRGLGVILAELERRGELDNTLVVVSGDHGIPGFPRAKCNLYDIGSEVGLMARYPGVIPVGHVVKDMTNIMDLAPTFLECAGCEPEPTMTAKSLWTRMTDVNSEERNSWIIIGRERHVATARELDLPYPQRAIRTKEFLYIHNFAPDRWPMGDPKGMDDLNAPAIPWEKLENDTRIAYADLDASPTKAWMVHNRGTQQYSKAFQLSFGKRPQEELFDLAKDPHLMENLSSHPEYQDIKKELHDTLMKELHAQNDPRVSEVPCRFEQSPYTDVYDHGGTLAESVASERLSRSGN